MCPQEEDKIEFPPIMGYSCSVLGGALGAGKIKGYGRDLLAACVGMAAHIAPAQVMTAWVKHARPATAKYLLAGWAAQASLAAAILPGLGHRVDLEILDGDFGFWRYIGSDKWEPDVVTKNLGDVWEFPEEQIYKYYPHCRILQLR